MMLASHATEEQITTCELVAQTDVQRHLTIVYVKIQLSVLANLHNRERAIQT